MLSYFWVFAVVCFFYCWWFVIVGLYGVTVWGGVGFMLSWVAVLIAFDLLCGYLCVGLW